VSPRSKNEESCCSHASVTGGRGDAASDPGVVDEGLVPLMVDYQAGRLDAFESLYAALADDVRRFFAASVPDSAAVPDLVQQTFLELHRARRTYRAPLPVRPWVFGIAVNVRRRHRRAAVSAGRRRGAGLEAVVEPSSPPKDTVADLGLRRALAQLPASRRRAWVLHHVHGFSFEEIGRRLGIGAGAAKLRSSRAMRALRSLLGSSAGHDDE
jgi:RNA polymerase sigma-70 factor (ECF subfamily)